MQLHKVHLISINLLLLFSLPWQLLAAAVAPAPDHHTAELVTAMSSPYTDQLVSSYPNLPVHCATRPQQMQPPRGRDHGKVTDAKQQGGLHCVMPGPCRAMPMW